MTNPFYIFTRSELVFMLVLFLLGIILGATTLNLIIGVKVDRLLLENRKLTEITGEQKLEIERLSQNLSRRQQRFVQKLTIKLNTELNQHTQQELIKQIKQLLSNIPGKNLEKLDPLLLIDILDQRSLMLNDDTYQLQVRYLILQENLELYVKIDN
ncbi:MAG: hypothetical protein ACOCZ3_00555 [Bacillota bacterium]